MSILRLVMDKTLDGFKEWSAAYFPVFTIRKAFLQARNVKIGRYSKVGMGTIIREDTTIGEKCFIGDNVVLEGYTKVGNNTRIESQCHITSYSTIGDYVFIGPFFVSTNDSRLSYHRKGHGTGLKGVTIENYARIAGHVMTLPGVTIGEGAIVGASSLVTRDVKPYTLVYGVPAHEHEDKHGLLKEKILESNI